MLSSRYQVIKFCAVKPLSKYLLEKPILADQIDYLLKYFPMFDKQKQGISYSFGIHKGLWKSWEKNLCTVIILDNEQLIGYGQLILKKNCVEICNVIVPENLRKKGIGKEILIELEDIAVKNGKSTFSLWCEDHVKPFYTKYDYIDNHINKVEHGFTLHKMSKQLIV